MDEHELDVESPYADAVRVIEELKVGDYLDPDTVLRIHDLLERSLVERVNELDEESQDEDTFRILVTKLQFTAWLAGFFTYAQNSSDDRPDVVVPVGVETIGRLLYGLGQGSVNIRLEVDE